MTSQPGQGKGKPTPKRSEAQKKRPTAQPAPRNRKEAAKRMREQRREQSLALRAAMKSGDVSALPARERTPEKIIARDFIDTRRSAGVLFAPIAMVLFAASGASKNSIVLSNFFSLIFFVGMAAIIIDSVRIYRGLGKLIRARIPGTKSVRSAAFYAMSRTTLPRRWRMPAPRIQRGDPIPE